MSLYRISLLSIYLIIIWSVINPKSYLTWSLEVIPVILISGYLWKKNTISYFTNFAYTWAFIGATLIIIGGHYTYSEVPVFNWLRDFFDLSRNNYDKLVHFVFGIIVSLFIKEYFIKEKIIINNNWINWIVLSVNISFGVIYEFFEWGIAIIAGGDATAFLGAQGDIWDAQSDVLYAMVSSILILFIFNKYHLKKINNNQLV